MNKFPKILVGFSIMALVTTVSSIFIASKLIFQRTQDAQKQSTVNVLTATSGSYTASQVLSHSTSSDCWLIIDQKVYDLTRFLVSHPGGAVVLTPYCGHDGTTAYRTKDRIPATTHSQEADKLLPQFYLGPFGSDQILPSTNPTQIPLPTPKKVISSSTSIIQVDNATQTLTSATVASHSTSSDCWVTISNNIYNLTNYLVEHPGGVGAITPYCGKDGTNAFQTRGGNGQHSAYANSLLNNYLLGTLGSSVTVTSPGSLSSPTSAPSTSGSCDDIPSVICTKYPDATKRSGSYEDNSSWEGKITTSSGICREIKVSSGGTISEDKSC